MPTHTVAVVQAGTSLFDTPATLERMRAHCETVRATGARLVVFPEAYVGGYPKGLDFGARLGSRTPKGRDDFLRYFRSAIDVPGVETGAMGEFAASMNSHMVVGVIERGGSTLYCTALFFGPDGALLAKHRKLLPTAMERIVWGRGDGSTMPVLDTAVGKIGAAICWENYMPAYRQTLYAKGIELYCAPTVDDREVWHSTMRHIAVEGRSFVLCACQYLTRADAPDDYACVEGDDPTTVLIRGGSTIVGPLGDVLAGPLYGREGVLSAEIDLEDLVRARYDFDPSGHYARPDIFRLTVDEAPRGPISAP